MRLLGIPRPPEGTKVHTHLVLRETDETWFFFAKCWPRLLVVDLYLRLYPFALPLAWAMLEVLHPSGRMTGPAHLAASLALVLLVALYFSLKHELGHLRGLPDGCVARHPWCVMAEEEMVGSQDGSGWGKLKLLVRQLPHGGRFCPGCKEVIGGNGGWD